MKICPQASGSVAPLRHNLRNACRGEFSGDGLQHSYPILHALIRDYEHCLFQVAHEQKSGIHHVPSILRLRRGFAHVRVRNDRVSCLKFVAPIT